METSTGSSAPVMCKLYRDFKQEFAVYTRWWLTWWAVPMYSTLPDQLVHSSLNLIQRRPALEPIANVLDRRMEYLIFGKGTSIGLSTKVGSNKPVEIS
jgi:hypothetical protein